jgi:hypothetical protein
VGVEMNEQIRALADQALKDCDAAKERGIDQYSKRFAELIVRECADRVTSKADRWGNMTDEIVNECILECAADLKNHFGVDK